MGGECSSEEDNENDHPLQDSDDDLLDLDLFGGDDDEEIVQPV